MGYKLCSVLGCQNNNEKNKELPFFTSKNELLLGNGRKPITADGKKLPQYIFALNVFRKKVQGVSYNFLH